MSLSPPVSLPETFPAAPTPYGIGPGLPSLTINPPQTAAPTLPKPRGTSQAQVDAARAAALNKRGAVGNKYNFDNLTYSDDVDRYESDVGRWNAIKGTLFQQFRVDYDSCWGDMVSEYQNGLSEGGSLRGAYEAIGNGDSYFTSGDNATDLDTQLYYFQQALAAYNNADSLCGNAESYHTATLNAATAAEGIMTNHGG